jgi:tetratricopeptide (TPR) repeat protein
VGAAPVATVRRGAAPVGQARRGRGAFAVALVMALLLLPVAQLAGQEGDAREAGSTGRGELSVRFPERVLAPGEAFELVLELEEISSTDIAVEEPAYPDIITKVSGPEIETRGTPGNYRAELRITYRAQQPGRAVFGPVAVSVAGRSERTERVLLEIGERGDPERVPFNARWNTPSGTVYQGQTVSVSLDVELIPEFTYPDTIDITPPAGTVFEEVQGVGSASATAFGDRLLYRYPVATFLMTPSQTGAVEIPPARVEALGFSREAAGRSVEVREVPGPVAQTGAVGQFRFSSSVSTRRLAEGERLTVRMTVEGTGNHTFLQFPEISADGFVRTASEEAQQFEPTVNGYRGSRTRTVELTAQESGRQRVVVPRFLWYDPDAGLVRSEERQRYRIAVGSALGNRGGSEERALSLRLLSLEEVRGSQPLNWYRKPEAYALLLPALFGALGVLLYRRFSRAKAVTLMGLVFLVAASQGDGSFPAERVRRGIEAYRAGNASEAVADFRAATEHAPDNPGILHNLAVAEYAAGQDGRAVFHAREALRVAPRFAPTREALSSIEESLGLSRQVERGRTVHPDVAFFASVGLFYLLCLLMIVRQSRKQGFYYVGLILVGILFLAAAVTIPVTAAEQRERIAVVTGTPGVLRKIPDASAESWLTLPEGTAVDLVASHGSFHLIATASGVQGWVSNEDLLQSGG